MLNSSSIEKHHGTTVSYKFSEPSLVQQGFVQASVNQQMPHMLSRSIPLMSSRTELLPSTAAAGLVASLLFCSLELVLLL